MRSIWRCAGMLAALLVLASGLFRAAPRQYPTAAGFAAAEEFGQEIPIEITGDNCSYLRNPAEFDLSPELLHTMRSEITAKVAMYMLAVTDDRGTALDAATVQRKNLIDDHIFSRMATAGIASAPLASDEEYLRRVTLDLTGRIPSQTDVESFLANTSPAKRDALVDSLIGTPEFVDKWTMFFGDLFKVNSLATNVNRFTQGRDAFYLYIKDALSTNKPYDQFARELITATGDNFVNGAANWPVGNTIPMGPSQDTYDGQAVNLAGMFMGIGAVDCLLCHDGPRHLDEVNLWGSTQTRQNMWGLSAYFARTRMQRQVITPMPLLAKFILSDTTTGDYQLNSTTGNRSPRQPLNGVTLITPKNPFSTATGSGINTGENYRQGIARQITGDLQFARAAVNYVWEKFMVEAFVSPSNSFDLARLDANSPPPAAWTLQPTNPQLLDALAKWFQTNRYDLRALMGLIAKSNAYQLSATYPGTWNVSYVPYYARRYVRRMDAEEVHDALLKATGVLPSPGYALDFLPAVQWAMQLPEPREPRRNGVVAAFLNAFGRGDRDLNLRRSDGTLSQALMMMNDPMVMTRIHQANQGSRVATLLAQTSDATTIITQLFLSTLSRRPTAQELASFSPAFAQLGARVAAENLQWVLLNKLDFLFNY